MLAIVAFPNLVSCTPAPPSAAPSSSQSSVALALEYAYLVPSSDGRQSQQTAAVMPNESASQNARVVQSPSHFSLIMSVTLNHIS